MYSENIYVSIIIKFKVIPIVITFTFIHWYRGRSYTRNKEQETFQESIVYLITYRPTLCICIVIIAFDKYIHYDLKS